MTGVVATMMASSTNTPAIIRHNRFFYWAVVNTQQADIKASLQM